MVRVNHSRRFTVYSAGSHQTIYGDKEVNYAFRAWHDWCHWKGEHDFSVEGERQVWLMQCRHLIGLYDDDARTRKWCDILYAEIVGQRLFYEEHRAYVEDQRRFVTEHLASHPHMLAAAETQKPIV